MLYCRKHTLTFSEADCIWFFMDLIFFSKSLSLVSLLPVWSWINVSRDDTLATHSSYRTFLSLMADFASPSFSSVLVTHSLSYITRQFIKIIMMHVSDMKIWIVKSRRIELCYFKCMMKI